MGLLIYLLTGLFFRVTLIALITSLLSGKHNASVGFAGY